ncbi:MAG: hypothetical protein KBS41_02235 [Oscillospiraceae bacterium]|nr:hypothetical protein [Candidatus Equicaccousia limihippi]
MKNKVLNYAVIILCLVITIVNLAFNIYNSFFYNLDDLPQGKFLFPSFSPDLKTLNIYKVDCPTLGKAVRGELSYEENGKKVTKNIYWEIGTDTAIVSWVDNDTVLINGNNVKIDSGFDSRRKITIPNAPAINKGIQSDK